MSNDLVIFQTLTPLAVFGSKESVDDIIDKVRAEVADAPKDISTEAGRAEIRSLAYKVARSKTAIDKMGKDLGEEWLRKKQALDAERRRIGTALEEIQEDVRRPLTEWENAEKERVKVREDRLKEIESLSIFDSQPEASDYERRLESLGQLSAFDWQEFAARSSAIVSKVKASLSDGLEARRKYDAEQAELARLRREEEERKAEAERQRIAAEAAAKARQEAEAKAASEAKAAQEKADREKAELERKAQEEKDRAARAEAEAKAAEERHAREMKEAAERAQKEAAAAAKREMERIEAQARAEAEETARREADKAHRTKINREALDDLVKEAGLGEEAAKAVVVAIAKGSVRNIKINY